MYRQERESRAAAGILHSVCTCDLLTSQHLCSVELHCTCWQNQRFCVACGICATLCKHELQRAASKQLAYLLLRGWDPFFGNAIATNASQHAAVGSPCWRLLGACRASPCCIASIGFVVIVRHTLIMPPCHSTKHTHCTALHGLCTDLQG